MATEADIIKRVRLELGDQPEPFRQTYRGTGFQDEFDLPSERISTTGLKVYKTDPATLVSTDLVLDSGFTLDVENGVLHLTPPLDKDWLLTAEGVAFGLFTDEELATFIHEALIQHTAGSGQYDVTRYRDSSGFIRYERIQKDLSNLPEEETHLVAILATIEVLWALSTDAATDIDITTSEGTHIPRSQRFQQLRLQIDTLTDKYQTLSMLMGVGLYAVGVSNLRRVSRTNNRLVPLYVSREYDDNTPPIRITPRIDDRDADYDGPPSAGYQTGPW